MADRSADTARGPGASADKSHRLPTFQIRTRIEMGVPKPQPFRSETISETQPTQGYGGRVCGRTLCAALLRARSGGVVSSSTLSPSGLHSNTNGGKVQSRLKHETSHSLYSYISGVL